MVVYISSTPKSLPGPLQAHFGSAAERWKMYKAAGAIGTITHRQPEEHGHSLVAIDAGAAAAGDVARRPGAGRGGWTEAVGDHEPRARGQAVRGLRPHLRRNPGAGRRRQGRAELRAAGPSQGHGRRRAVAGGVAERRRHPARLGSEAARRVRRRVGAPGSSRHRRRGQRRHDLQRRDGQRVGDRGHPGSGGVAARVRRRSRRGRSCSSRSPAKKRASSARAISRHTPRCPRRASSPT